LFLAIATFLYQRHRSRKTEGISTVREYHDIYFLYENILLNKITKSMVVDKLFGSIWLVKQSRRSLPNLLRVQKKILREFEGDNDE
jgi:hypothetical protein